MASPTAVLEALRRDLAAGRVDPAYLLIGEESFLKEEAQRAIQQSVLGGAGEAGSWDLTILEGPACSMAEILDSARTLPMFAARRLVWVKETEKMREPEVDPLREYLRAPSPHATLLFSTGPGKPDFRRTLLKTLQGSARVLEFPPLKGREVPDWIRRRAKELDAQVDTDAVLLLELEIGADLHRLDQELNKAMDFSAPSRRISLEILEETLGAQAAGSSFEFAELCAAGETEGAIRLLRRNLAEGEEPVRLLFLLARHLRLLILGQALMSAGRGGRELAADLGIPPYPFLIEKVKKQIRRFPAPAASPALRLILEADRAIKSGAGRPSGVLERLVLDLGSSVRGAGRIREAHP